MAVNGLFDPPPPKKKNKYYVGLSFNSIHIILDGLVSNLSYVPQGHEVFV